MFHPWRQLRDLPQIDLFWQESDIELGHSTFDPPCITITSGMTQAERRSTLTHELIHHERGPVPEAQREREERIVERETARRLIDIRKLGDALAWSRNRTVAAEELWVDVSTLQTRLAALHPAERHYLNQRLSDPAVPI